MSQIPKWIGPYVIAVGAGLTLVGGSLVRERVDLGTKPKVISAQGIKVENLVASRDQEIELSATEYFTQLVRLVKSEYVEPIAQDMPLATGAVRGMVASLGDTRSVFMDADEFRAFQSAKAGTFEGIGVELALLSAGQAGQVSQAALQPTGESGPEEALAMSAKIPKLTVVGLVPDGPATKAGVKLGDTVYAVNDHWVVSSDVLDEFSAARKQFQAKKITAFELNTLRKKLKAQTERALLPLKAKRTLVVGTNGTVSVEWRRGTTPLKTAMQKGTSKIPATANGAICLRFNAGGSDALKSALATKQPIQIDLRNNAHGDFSEVKKALSMVASTGNYGYVRTEKSSTATPLTLNSTAKPASIKLIVDASTRGAAEIFAIALTGKGHAKLEGGRMGGELQIVDTTKLPDGTGYTLVTGEYSLNSPVAAKKKGGKE